MLTAQNIQGDLQKWLSQVATLDDNIPMLLMPLRVEARFITSVALPGQIQPPQQMLWVRIFPDDFFLVNHETGLTQREVDATKAFWQTWVKAGPDKEAQIAAWSNLVSTITTQRAAWAIRQLDPRPKNGELPPTHIFKDADFPAVTLKPDDWTEPVRAIGLPDNFIVIGARGGVLTHISIGDPVPESLQIGLNPDETAVPSFTPDNTGNLNVAQELRWLTDPVEAKSKGMAIIVPLNADNAALGFDELYVLGVRTKRDGAEIIEKLLQSHQYSPNGLGLVAPGTPTNNTPDVPAGYGSAERDAAWSYELEFGANPFQPENAEPTTLPDGQRLAHALGVGGDNFSRIENRNQREIAEAEAFRSLLWYGTMGSYMEDYFEKIFTYDNIERTRHFFNRYVAATGTLPVLRAGKQPYGILPATAFSKLYFDNLEALWTYKSDVTDKEQRLQLRFEAKLATFLWELHQYWTQLRNTHVKSLYLSLKTATDPTYLFLEMLSAQPVSVDYHARYGANVARWNEPPFLPVAPSHANSAIKNKLSGLIMAGDYRETPFFTTDNTPTGRNRDNARVLRMGDMQPNELRFWNKSVKIKMPLVASEADPDKPLPTLIGSNKTAIDWLLENSLKEIRTKYNLLPEPTNTAVPPVTLLFTFLRSSLLGVYRKAATRILLKEGFFDEMYLRLIGSPDKFRFPYKENIPQPPVVHFTPWSLLFWNINQLEGMDERSYAQQKFYTYLQNKSLADYLAPAATALRDAYPDKNKHADSLQELETFRKKLADLSQKPVGQLERLLSGQIDLCTYRLDAWMSGLAAQRLEQQRQKQPTGLWLGAYGYLENLRRTPNRTAATNVPEELKNAVGNPAFNFPIETDAGNQGLIHAPSSQQAVAAAILRSSYEQSGKQTPQAKRMAINLSSARVRRALQLLEGLSNGLSISQLLGQQLERGLHERFADAEMDVFIQPLRKQFPLEFAVQETSNTTVQPQPGYVINGYELLQQFEAVYDNMPPETPNPANYLFANCPPLIKNLVFTKSKQPTQAGKDKQLQVLLEEIDKLADTFDAFGDLILSESVYQLVQGNRARAAAVLNAAMEGRVPPPPEIVQMPSSGTNIQQRIWCNMPAITNVRGKPIGWVALLSPRAAAEPSLNHWLGKLLGHAGNIRCICTFQTEGVPTPQNIEVTVARLNLQPIDLYCIAAGNADNGKQELNARLAQFIQKQPNIGTITAFNANFSGRDPLWTARHRSLGEVLELLAYLGKAFTESRFATANDFNATILASVEVAQMRTRVQAAHNALSALHNKVRDFITRFGILPDVVVEDPNVREEGWLLLLEMSSFGVSGALPGWNEAQWTTRFATAFDTLTKRFTEAEKLRTTPENPNDELQTLRQLSDWGKAIFGNEYVVLPLFKPEKLSVEPLKTQLNLPATQNLLRHNPAFSMDEWIDGVATVRPKVYAWNTAKLLNTFFETQPPVPMPVQIPYQQGDYWVGGEAPNTFWSTTRDRNFLSVIVLHPVNAFNDAVWTGLVLDEWIEMVPDRERRTGVAFHYNQPDARPPQTLILAVPPEVKGKWDAEDLFLTVKETIEMAKNRLVEPEHLLKSDLSHLLPGVMAEMILDKNNILQSLSNEIIYQNAWVATQFSDLSKPPN